MSVRSTDGRVPVMLPFKHGPRGEARRVKRYALPGEFVYNFGWRDDIPDSGSVPFPCAVFSLCSGALGDYVLASYGDRIKPRGIPLMCLRPVDDAAQETLRALLAEHRLRRDSEVTTLTVNMSDFAKPGDTITAVGQQLEQVPMSAGWTRGYTQKALTNAGIGPGLLQRLLNLGMARRAKYHRRRYKVMAAGIEPAHVEELKAALAAQDRLSTERKDYLSWDQIQALHEGREL